MYAHSLSDKNLVLSKSEIIGRFKSSYDKYHWCDEKKRSIDYRYLEHVYQSILPVLANTLNKAHNLSRDNQY